MGLAVLGSVLGMGVTLLTGQVVGAVPGVIDDAPGAMSMTEFSWLLGALLTVFVLESLTPAIHRVASLIMDAALVREIGTGITEPLLRPRRVTHLEDSEVLDVQDRAKGKGGFHLAQGLANLPWLMASRVTLVGSAVIVGVMFSWWVAGMLVAVTAPAGVVRRPPDRARDRRVVGQHRGAAAGELPVRPRHARRAQGAPRLRTA